MPLRRAAGLQYTGDLVDSPSQVVAGRELPLGATYPAVVWLLQQRTFSLDDLMARYPFVDAAEMQAILQSFLRAGIIVETEMR